MIQCDVFVWGRYGGYPGYHDEQIALTKLCDQAKPGLRRNASGKQKFVAKSNHPFTALAPKQHKENGGRG